MQDLRLEVRLTAFCNLHSSLSCGAGLVGAPAAELNACFLCTSTLLLLALRPSCTAIFRSAALVQTSPCAHLSDSCPPKSLLVADALVVDAQASTCSAGDSAGYLRRGSALDDVVVVSALRTPVTKVRGCSYVKYLLASCVSRLVLPAGGASVGSL